MTRRERALMKALEDARDCLWDELMSNSPEEIKEHPTLREHQKVAGRATRLLRKIAAEEAAKKEKDKT